MIYTNLCKYTIMLMLQLTESHAEMPEWCYG